MRPLQVAKGLLATMALMGAVDPVVVPAPLRAQAPASRATSQLSADTIGIGDVFELRVSLPVAPDRVAYFPDSLPSSESYATFGPAQWTAERASDGSATLTITYRLLALRIGIVSVPPFDVFTLPGRPEPDVLTGAWESLPQPPAANADARVRVPEARLWVASVLLLDDITSGLRPRPAADVWGGDRHWPSTLLMLAFGGLLVGVGGATTRELLERGRPSAELAPPLSPKEVALRALDDLLEAGLHANGRIDEFYLRSSDIARRYIETLHPSWRDALTSGELMAALGRHLTGRDHHGLEREMRLAETVKFGLARPEVEAAETHWRAVYEWIEHSRAGS